MEQKIFISSQTNEKHNYRRNTSLKPKELFSPSLQKRWWTEGYVDTIAAKISDKHWIALIHDFTYFFSWWTLSVGPQRLFRQINAYWEYLKCNISSTSLVPKVHKRKRWIYTELYWKFIKEAEMTWTSLNEYVDGRQSSIDADSAFVSLKQLLLQAAFSRHLKAQSSQSRAIFG